MSDQLTEGAQSPDFSAPTETGEAFSSADAAGKWLVLYFYPKDDTPGCTKEAIGFTERVEQFDSLGARIVGVSKDTVKKHQNFIKKHDLKVTLLSDEDGKVCDSFGVWVEKSMYGRTYMGIERATYLIAPDGKIAKIWRKVRVPGHVEAVLNELTERLN